MNKDKTDGPKRKVGYARSEGLQFADRVDRDVSELLDQLAAVTLSIKKVVGTKKEEQLPAKYRELVVIGILAFRGREDLVLRHMQRAAAEGITRDELLGAVEATILPGGADTYSVGMHALLRIWDELA